jgi:methylase of polypeptide subunit release factors
VTVSAPSSVNAELRRRLGQFFTGHRLSSLLAHLAQSERADAILDPMVGSGDMLVAAFKSGARPSFIGGVEIEPTALGLCRSSLEDLAPSTATVVLRQGNAFDPSQWQVLGSRPWDLVITNPPYVRYQRTSKTSLGEVDLPSAAEVRAGLVAVLASLPEIDLGFRSFLEASAQGYSGLSDLAVPSWLLCAALVREGGRLAMVVPDTWLSREYAVPLTEVLDRFFEVEFVVHDADASWFPDASVRTTLYVARRKMMSESGANRTPKRELHIRIERNAANESSLVGNALLTDEDPDAQFAAIGRQWLADGHGPELLGCHFDWLSRDERAATTSHSSPGKVSRTLSPTPRLREVLTRSGARFMSLADLGWSVGQGLRTGANTFFYASLVSQERDSVLLKTAPNLLGVELEVPRDAVQSVVRNQQDLPLGWALDGDSILGRVLALQRYARAADFPGESGTEGDRQSGFHKMPAALDQYIAKVERLNVGTVDQPRFVPLLSAVRTNVRRFSPETPAVSPRFWYQLPPFAPRHRPDLAIPRVNYLHPRVVLNPGRSSLIDANFSTLWCSDQDGLHPLAMLAIFASSWVTTSMETLGTVLGGGALKLEAAQLRRLALPEDLRAAEAELMRHGHDLMDGDDADATRSKIDVVMWRMFAPALDSTTIEAVRALATRCLEARSRR